MKFHNTYGTEQITVLPGKLYDDTQYVGISHGAGAMQFVWTMSTEQARSLGEYLVSLADKAVDEATIKSLEAA